MPGQSLIMMAQNLKRNTFESKQSIILKESLYRNAFTDVTLVSDDKVPFKAHKFVLGSFSPVLKDLLLHNPHKHPIIFLREVNQYELKSIMEVIYLGETQYSNDNIKKLLRILKKLQRKDSREGLNSITEPILSSKKTLEPEVKNS